MWEAGAGDSRYTSRPTQTSAPRIAAPRPQPLIPFPRHHSLLARQLLERRPRQVHELRVMSSPAAQRLLPGMCWGSFGLLWAVVAHLGGRPEPGPCAGAAFWLPGLETVPQEREVYHPHRGDRRGGLSWRSADPVTMSSPGHQETVPTRHSFIRAEPAPASQTRATLLPSQGCAGMGDRQVNHLSEARIQASEEPPRHRTALSLAPGQKRTPRLAHTTPHG